MGNGSSQGCLLVCGRPGCTTVPPGAIYLRPWVREAQPVHRRALPRVCVGLTEPGWNVCPSLRTAVSTGGALHLCRGPFFQVPWSFRILRADPQRSFWAALPGAFFPPGGHFFRPGRCRLERAPRRPVPARSLLRAGMPVLFVASSVLFG